MPEQRAHKHLVIFQPSGRRGYVAEGKTLKEASVALGVDIEGICGEKAICGKCKVRIEEGAFEKYGIESSRLHLSQMAQTERKFFSLHQERGGYRLACQAQVLGDVVVYVPEESRLGKQVVRKAARDIAIDLNPAVRKYYVELPKATLEDTLGDWERIQAALNTQYGLTNLTIDYQVLLVLQNVVRAGDWKVTLSVWMGKEVIKAEPGKVDKAYGLAVDVGSTTVAGYLCDLTDGRLITTSSMMNPQVIYGEDVMSRITYTMTNPEGLDQLNKAIIDGLNGIVSDVADAAGIGGQDIVDMTIVGNTCMHHLFLNIDPNCIGRAPFPPSLHHSLNVKARDWGLKIMPEVKREKGGYPACQATCPAGINGQDFLYLIAQGKYDEALEEVRRAMPFAGVCGRVCTHPCERECERGKVDEPLALRSLHRFVADRELENGRPTAAPMEQTKTDRVAIVGSGPAGLSCAYELVREGYPTTVFEAAPKAGGMLRYGIPEYRLPRRVLDNEIRFIEELGVEIKTSSRVGDLKQLFDQGYRAVFLATGAWVSQKMGIPGEDVSGVIPALSFLNWVNSGEKVKVGKRVVVVGGGNSAVDSARVAKRLGAEEVAILYRRSRAEMPAIASEIDEAEREGVQFHFLTAPVATLASDGKLSGLSCIRMELGEPDESGRKRPVPVPGSEFTMEADTIVAAIGQAVDKTTLLGEPGHAGDGFLDVDRDTLQTGIAGVFAGGDILGPSDVISAVAAGKRAATSISLYLEGVDPKQVKPTQLKKIEDVPKEGVGKEARTPMPMLEIEARGDFAEVERGYAEQAAQQECKRCLNCGVYADVEAGETAQARDVGIKIAPGAYIHVLPIEAGFVGADNVGVLIAEQPHKQDSIELIIDIGTNGELVLGNRHKLISSSCATGPALEGAEIRFGMRASPGAIEKIEIDRETKEVRFKVIDNDKWNTDLPPEEVGAKGICGSGIIDVLPQLFMAGIIDKTGRFSKSLNTPRFRTSEDGEPEFVIAWANETSIGQDIVVCQGDVRNIQLAKAAMYAGAKIMMRRLGVERLDKVILAGAFGSYIDKISAAMLGLFPDCELENIYAVGNAAGDGARIALLNVDRRREADEVARQVEYVELTVEPDFDKIFGQSMWIPHMKDAFPHLSHLFQKEASAKA